jgi:beta-glucosidase
LLGVAVDERQRYRSNYEQSLKGKRPSLNRFMSTLRWSIHFGTIARLQRNSESHMNKRPAIAALLLALLTLLEGARAASPQASQPWLNTKLSPDARAAKLVAAMTLDEKLLLVFGYMGATYPENCAPPQPCYQPPAQAIEGSAGYIPGVPRLSIPAQWQTDASLGVATSALGKIKRERTALPSGLASAATWNPDLAREAGAMIGDEARRSGFNVMLAGGVNLLREPRNGRNFEYAGEDPLLAGTIVGAQVTGIQSNHLISTVKHFAVNDQETDRHAANSILDPAAARMSDLLAFQIALERSNAGSVMSSYNLLNGTYASENKWLLADVLRADWGFKGYVMSDWGGVHSTVAAALAGLDQESGFPFDITPYFREPLKAAVAKGDVNMPRIDEMVRRIVRSMFAHGLFEYPATAQAVDYVGHSDVSRKAAEQSAVLLKNVNAILPLALDTKRIAVIGGYADKGVLAGGGSSLVYPIGGNAVPNILPTSWPGPIMYYPSSPVAEMRKLAPQATITFDNGFDQNGAVRLARNSDVVIIFATQWAGEAFDVAMHLDGQQEQLIAAVASANPKTVVVLETGGPVLMPWSNQVAGILEAWYPGTAGGTAIANLLFGKANPSGHLPVTFPQSLEQLPHPSAPASGDVRYTEGAAVGYKWFDAKGYEPLFAFGHGLSYTTFAFSKLAATASAGSIAVNFLVRNTGTRMGMGVPQVYVGGDGWEASQRLAGWQKVALAPGATTTLTLTVDPRVIAMFDVTTNTWKISAGTYRVMLGSSARQIDETVTVQLPAMTLPAGWHPQN